MTDAGNVVPLRRKVGDPDALAAAVRAAIKDDLDRVREFHAGLAKKHRAAGKIDLAESYDQLAACIQVVMVTAQAAANKAIARAAAGAED